MEAFIRPAGHLYKTGWKTPLLCALSLHLLVFGGSLYMPDILKTKPKFAKIQMVNLVNLAAPAPPSSTPGKKPAKKPPVLPEKVQSQPKPAPVNKVVPKKKVVEVKPAPVKKVAPKVVEKPAVNDVPTKTISLDPKRKKIKKKITPPPPKKSKAEKERAKREAHEIAQRLKQEALLEKEAQLTAERAKLAQQALEKEKALLKDIPDIPPSRQQTGRSAPSQEQVDISSGRSNIVANQYFSTVAAIIQSHWALPPDLEKQSQLQAVVVIKINRNGRIVDMFFEKKSANTMYNQFVVNTINASNPLPSIPTALNKQEIEFGITLSREGVH